MPDNWPGSKGWRELPDVDVSHPNSPCAFFLLALSVCLPLAVCRALSLPVRPFPPSPTTTSIPAVLPTLDHRPWLWYTSVIENTLVSGIDSPKKNKVVRPLWQMLLGLSDRIGYETTLLAPTPMARTHMPGQRRLENAHGPLCFSVRILLCGFAIAPCMLPVIPTASGCMRYALLWQMIQAVIGDHLILSVCTVVLYYFQTTRWVVCTPSTGGKI